MKKSLLAILLGMTPAFACAQPVARPQPQENVRVEAAAPAAPERPATPPLPGANRDADPALWVVRDRDTTIYLFGTIHPPAVERRGRSIRHDSSVSRARSRRNSRVSIAGVIQQFART